MGTATKRGMRRKNHTKVSIYEAESSAGVSCVIVWIIYLFKPNELNSKPKNNIATKKIIIPSPKTIEPSSRTIIGFWGVPEREVEAVTLQSEV